MRKIIMASMVFSLIFFLSGAYDGWDPRDKEEEERAVNETIKNLLSIHPLILLLAYQRLDMSHRLTYDMAYDQKWR